jgi:hypothetical protein
MIHTVFIDLDKEVARAATTGTGLPAVSLKLRTEQTIAFAFMTDGVVAAVSGWTSGKCVLKETRKSAVLLLDSTLDTSGSGTTTRYKAVWTASTLDGPADGALDKFMGETVEPKSCWAEVEWVDASGTHSVAFPISLVPTFNSDEDEAPDPAASASWDWLKARLAAGSNVTLTTNNTLKTITIAASGGGTWGSITGVPAPLTIYAGIDPSSHVQSFLGAANYAAMRSQLSLVPGTDVQIQSTALNTLTGFGSPYQSGVPGWNGATFSDLSASALRTRAALENVENTAISTWAGSVNLTTVGTVGTGTWNATAIALGKIAQGGAATNQVMSWNGTTWAAAGSITDMVNQVTSPAAMSVGYLGVPQNSKSANYTLVLADSGEHLYHPTADTTARTWTIPANDSVAYPIGTALTFVNDTGAGVITIAIDSDTMILAGAGTTGSRTLAANGMATAVKVTSTRWMISGAGLT